jgi:hydroxymethylpyrimidine/phosphomethylpyrimidine kinase
MQNNATASTPRLNKPVVLCIGGFDPSGCAGLHADIETLSALGCHAMSVVSCQTIQNAQGMYSTVATDPSLFKTQLECLESTHRFEAIKIGALSEMKLIQITLEFILRHRNVAIILDPVISASSGLTFLDHDSIEFFCTQLMPAATLITPNHAELHLMGKNQETEKALQYLFDLGAQSILLTGGHEKISIEDINIHNRLFTAQGLIKKWSITRAPGQFRGTGCMLASAIAVFHAQGYDIMESIEKAQSFASRSIANSFYLNKVCIPDRGYSH